MIATVFKEFKFEAAHRLPNVPEGHKCGRLHGHSYRVEVHVTGGVAEPEGWAVDFGEISRHVGQLVDLQLDHRYLNDLCGLDNPTSENLARWLWTRIKLVLPGLSKIIVRETCTSGCVYEGF